ncbi:Reverse transcriptase zinc-binding domain [Arabidopsis thaliana x Arabidopsis arenosa]|uniref:Reverse transcriptase zinc-binding domain n=1 Tax=Arabidopsis thaliana x Arabidopsis arenosa TaxID=1240361 RepID=A0A8T1XGI4_9BRAS|nr:Reverse transcriptase zinc-binding domain [Arabidopsis thaliana x Arabidopsis arenosa]
MSSHKAKVSWEAICKPKQEGGLGLRSLKEANDVCCLKLIWRIASHGDSLWVKWLETYLLKQKSFWSIKSNTVLGSWIWKKLLKYRGVAKKFCKVEVKNGNSTSFWYDNWSTLGRLVDVVGERGVIDLGIQRGMSVAEAWHSRRSRRHRTEALNQIENVLAVSKQNRTEAVDIVLWRGRNDMYRPQFSTRDTWNHIRTTTNKVAWHRGIWFTHATPKFSFCLWLAVLNRLSTGDRMARWNVRSSVACVFCNHCMETRDHLFFTCVYASEIWTATAKNLLKARYTTDWQTLITIVSEMQRNRVESFLLRYALQASVYTIWRERNGRKHGEKPNSATRLIGWIDKQIRNNLSSIRIMGDRRYEEGLQIWFASRV